MRRRSLLRGLALAPVLLTACEREEPMAAVAPGDYAILMSNEASYRHAEEGHARVVLVSPGGAVKGVVEFTPRAQGRLLSHRGGLAWVSADAVHLWRDDHRQWQGVSKVGSLAHLMPAGEDVLAVLNEGTFDEKSYSSAFARFGSGEPTFWAYPAAVERGVAWTPRGVLGFAGESLFDPDVRLEFIGPTVKGIHFGQALPVSAVWDRMLTIGERVWALVSPQLAAGPAELWRIDPVAQQVEVVRLHGPQLDVASWYEGSNGPRDLVWLPGGVGWLGEGSLWLADVATGAVTRVGEVPRGDDVAWSLTANGLLGMRQAGKRWDLTHLDPETLRPLREVRAIDVGGPADVWPSSTVVA